MKKICDCCGLPMTYDVDGSCIDCALLTIDDEVAQHACVMAVTHLIADAIKDPTLGMPQLGVSRNGSFPVVDRKDPRNHPCTTNFGCPCQDCENMRAADRAANAERMVPMADVVTYDAMARIEKCLDDMQAGHEMIKEASGGGCSLCHADSHYAKSDTRGRCYECSVKP